MRAPASLARLLGALLLLPAGLSAAPAPPPEDCVRTLGTVRDEQLIDSRPTREGSLLTLSLVEDEAGSTDIWLAELLDDGTVLRERAHGGPGEESAASLEPTPDGGWLVAGRTDSVGPGHPVPWLLKLDEDLEVEWERALVDAGPSFFDVHAVPATAGYLLAASVISVFGAEDVLVARLDLDGSSITQQTLGFLGDDVVLDLAGTDDGGAVLVGTSGNEARTEFRAWIAKLSSVGFVEWERRLGIGGGFDVAGSVLQLADGSLAVSGRGLAPGREDLDLWLANLLLDGSPSWLTRIDAPFNERDAALAEAGDRILLAGGDADPSAGGQDGLLLALDRLGELLWSRRWGGASFDVLAVVAGREDDGLFAAGTTESLGFGAGDLLLLELELGSEASCIEDLEAVRAPPDLDFETGPTPSRAVALGWTPTSTPTRSRETRRELHCAAPPVIECPADLVVGTGPDDEDCRAEPDLPPAEALAACGQEVAVSDDAPASFPLGETLVRFTAVDELGRSAECSMTVTVIDDTPPRIEDLRFEPDCLWTPNHAVFVLDPARHLIVDAVDNCGGPLEVELLGCVSDETEDGLGDGAFAPDCRLLDDGRLAVRAERSGTGDGRSYAVEVGVRDEAGNLATGVATIRVVHDQREHDCPRLPLAPAGRK